VPASDYVSTFRGERDEPDLCRSLTRTIVDLDGELQARIEQAAPVASSGRTHSTSSICELPEF
jgi:hypothetical protein